MEKILNWARVYFLMQGVGVCVWWLMLVAAPETRAPFIPKNTSDVSLLAFWLPDLLLIAAGSIVAAAAIYYRSRYKTAAMWLVTGATSYAALYTIVLSALTDGGWLGVVLMIPAMLGSGIFATSITFEYQIFRHGKRSSTNYILLKTFSQIAVVWTIILFVFPYLISLVEAKLNFPTLKFPSQKPIAAMFFVLSSSVGIWAAYVMSKFGKGTPLPLDHATELVIEGPYAYVRNPMAVSGILQGLAVALYLGSPLVALYALAGSLIWQVIFRSIEEEDMRNRFGESYDDYRNAVKCWRPTLRNYQSDGASDSSNSVDVPSGRM